MTEAQQHLYDRLQMMCLAEECLIGTEREMHQRIGKPNLISNLNALIAARRVMFSLHGEQWRIRIVKERVAL